MAEPQITRIFDTLIKLHQIDPKSNYDEILKQLLQIDPKSNYDEILKQLLNNIRISITKIDKISQDDKELMMNKLNKYPVNMDDFTSLMSIWQKYQENN